VADEVEYVLAKLTRRSPADPAALKRLSAAAGMGLPREYLMFMASSDGGDGDVGEAWIEVWPVARVFEELERRPPHYEGVVLFAGDGANTVYGFDRFRDGEVVEGDWIGLNWDELIGHGTFVDFVTNLATTQG
jgi:hypothetical protein